MARDISLGTLRARIIARGDLRIVRHPVAELNDWINEAIMELVDLVMGINEDWYLSLTPAAITVVAGTQNYSLPSDFYKAVRVKVQSDSGDNWYNMRQFNKGMLDADLEGISKVDSFYRIVGLDTIRIEPNPTWSGNVRVWYLFVPGGLAADGDEFNGIFGWEEFVVLSVLLRTKQKDDEDITSTAALLGAQTERILSRAKDRDVGEPDKVRDVRTRYVLDRYPWARLPRP